MSELQSLAMGKQTTATLRFDEDLLPRVDAIARALSTEWVVASRADALRFIVSLGIEAAETAKGITPAPTKPAKASKPR